MAMVTMLTPLVLLTITGLHVSEEHVSLMSHVARQTRDTSQQCGPHSYACAGTPRCVLSSQVLNIMMNVKYPFIHFSFHAFESDFIKSTLVLPTKCDAHSFQMSAFEKFWILCAFPKKYTNLQFGRYPHADKIKAEWRSKLFPLPLSLPPLSRPHSS